MRANMPAQHVIEREFPHTRKLSNGPKLSYRKAGGAEMVSRADHTNADCTSADHATSDVVLDPLAAVDVAYSPAVERHLGKPNSAERRMRLSGIRHRLQTEGSPVVIRETGEPPVIAYFAGDARAGHEDFYIADLSALPAPTFDVLNTVFGLSAAEARLAQFLARGESIESAAELLEIKPTTARSQLAAVFDKTGMRRQARLVALLSRLAHTN
jgi:DNA-binding CsgD family transcriptional regulator